MHPAIELSEDERATLLERPLAMRFATCSPEGMPHVVPVWYLYRDGSVYFDTDADSVKVRNVISNGVAAGVVDTGDDYSELKGVMVQGEARVLEDPEWLQFVADGYTEKYWDGDMPTHVRERNETTEKVVVELTTSHETGWDFGKVSDKWKD